MRHTPYLSRIGDTLRLAVLAALLLLTGCAAPGTVSMDKLIERGLAAAGKEDWSSALDYFEKAQAVAPHAPLNAFNLGLAHAKSGHDLVAVVWFHTYLAAVPDAANAAQVRSEIRRLEASAEAKIKHVLSQALVAAEQLPIKDRWIHAKSIAEEQAKVGYMGGMDRTLKRGQEWKKAVYPKEFMWKDYGEYLRKHKYLYFARMLAEAGDIEAAESLLAQRPPPATGKLIYSEYRSIFRGLLTAYAERTDIDGLNRALAKIPVAERKYFMLSSAVSALLDAGEVKAAQSLAREANSPTAVGVLLSHVAEHLLDSARFAEARAQAQEAARLITNLKDDAILFNKSTKIKAKAEMLALSGNFNQALELLRQNKQLYWLVEITSIQVRLGAMTAARRAASAQPRDPYYLVLAADAYLLYGEGKTDRAIAKMGKQYSEEDAKFPLASTIPEVRKRLYDILLSHAAAVGRPADAEKLLAASQLPADVKPEWYRRIATTYAGKGDVKNATRLAALAIETEKVVRGGWRPRSPAQQAEVDAWLEFARDFGERGGSGWKGGRYFISIKRDLEHTRAMYDKGGVLGMFEKEGVPPSGIAGVASNRAKILFKIRALEKRFARQAAGGA